MNLWIAAICITAAAVSLILIARRRQSRAQRLGSAAIQVAIWSLVWILWQPPLLPALLERAKPPLNNLPLPGNELRRDALRDLPPRRLQKSAAAVATGWYFDWQQRLTLGDTLQLNITTSGPIEQPARITLKDPFDLPITSVATSAGEQVQISLIDVPKLSGRQLYRLEIELGAPGSSITYREPVPVLVDDPQPPKTLLWLARPSFETAALSRWLRQADVPLQVITRLAPEIVRRESSADFTVGESNPLAPTQPFELVILDSRLWPQLSALQRRQLDHWAGKKSLLWLVMADSPQGFITYAGTQNMPLEPGKSARVAAPAADGPQPPTLKQSGYRPRNTGEKIQLAAQNGAPLYWQHKAPDTNLGFVLFTDSYRWLTAGFAEQYSRLWKSLLDRQLAGLGRSAPMALAARLPRTGQRVSLCGPGFGDTPPQLMKYQNDAKLTLVPVSGIAANFGPTAHCYSFWPTESGWYHISGNNTQGFYVFAEQDWTLWQQTLARAETRQMASARLGPDVAESDRRPIPKYWAALALLFLLSLAWWRERVTN